MKFRILLVAAAILFLPATRVLAQNSDKDKDAKNEKPAEKCDAAATKEEVSTTDHTIRIGRQNIPVQSDGEHDAAEERQRRCDGIAVFGCVHAQ